MADKLSKCPEVDYTALGARVHTLRRAAGMTQAMLAERAGVSVSFIGHIERGEKKASIETVVRLRAALDTSADFLLLGVRGQCAGEDCPLREGLAALVREYGV